jgi:hypothetical protein
MFEKLKLAFVRTKLQFTIFKEFIFGWVKKQRENIDNPNVSPKDMAKQMFDIWGKKRQ